MEIQSYKLYTPGTSYSRVQIKQQQVTNPIILPQLSKDIVSFGSKDLLSESDITILKKVRSASASYKNMLGEGGEAVVYFIPDTEYCVRIPWMSWKEKVQNFDCKLDKNVTAQDKVNHVVAKYGDNVTIMKLIPGVPVLTYDMDPKLAVAIGDKIASFPVESYSKFLHQICEAYDQGMMFDCNWTNVIVDKNSKTLTAIDFNKIDIYQNERFYPLKYFYEALVHEYTTPEQKKIYAKKILNCALDEYQPTVKPCYDLLDNIDHFITVVTTACLNRSETLVISRRLCQLFNRIRELKEADLANIDVSNELTFKIKSARNFVNKLLKTT